MTNYNTVWWWADCIRGIA